MSVIGSSENNFQSRHQSFQNLLIHLGPFLIEKLSISRNYRYILQYSPNIVERRIENQEGNDELIDFFTFLLRKTEPELKDFLKILIKLKHDDITTKLSKYLEWNGNEPMNLRIRQGIIEKEQVELQLKSQRITSTSLIRPESINDDASIRNCLNWIAGSYCGRQIKANLATRLLQRNVITTDDWDELFNTNQRVDDQHFVLHIILARVERVCKSEAKRRTLAFFDALDETLFDDDFRKSLIYAQIGNIERAKVSLSH